MELIDISVNLASGQFKADIPDTLRRAQEAGVTKQILTGTSVDGSEQLLDLRNEYAARFPEMLYSTVGVHPHHASEYTPDSQHHLHSLSQQQGVVAIGETGLDFNRNYSSPRQQEDAFVSQLELAAETGLPLFMHERDAHQRQFEILKQHRDQFSEGVIHCFTGDRQALFNYLDLNLHIGITGWICDERRGPELQRLVHNIPLDRLLLETDAPYLLPRTIQPKPTSRRNEPAYLPWVLASVTVHRPESEVEIAAATSATATAFFRL